MNGANNERLTFNNGTYKFNYIENQILIYTEFSDQISRNFILDLGAPTGVVFMDSSLAHIITDKKSIPSINNTQSATGAKMKHKYIPWGTIKTNWFTLENSFMSSLDRPDPFACNKISGIWGADLFSPNFKGLGNKILLIQMQDSMVSILDSLPNIDKWICIESDFSIMSYIKIKASIDGKLMYFYFDTGFSGSMILTRETYNAMHKDTNKLYDEKMIYGYITNSLSGTQIDTAYSGISALNLSNGLLTDSITWLSTKSLIVNALGMEYIRRFNVLVDYQGRKLYLQPNPNYRKSQKTFFQSKGFKARNMDGNTILVINMEVNGPAEKAGLKVGDQILSINNMDADKRDNCEVVRMISEIDGKSTQNEVTIKRGNEIMKFTL